MLSFYGIDPKHAHAIIEDTSDNSLIVSMRNQDAVVKFTRDGQLKWIPGPTNNFQSQRALRSSWETLMGKPWGKVALRINRLTA